MVIGDKDRTGLAGLAHGEGAAEPCLAGVSGSEDTDDAIAGLVQRCFISGLGRQDQQGTQQAAQQENAVSLLFPGCLLLILKIGESVRGAWLYFFDAEADLMRTEIEACAVCNGCSLAGEFPAILQQCAEGGVQVCKEEGTVSPP